MPVARKGNKLFIETQMVNNFILAISRAGKTEILIIPTIDILSRAKIKTRMIILDVKGEISRATVPMLLDRSYEVVIYDFLDFMHTNFFNPFNAVVEAFKAGRFDDA